MVENFSFYICFTYFNFIFSVFDILLRVSEGESWDQAILGVLPMRKGAIALESSTTTSNAADTEEKTPVSSDETINDLKEESGKTEKVL